MGLLAGVLFGLFLLGSNDRGDIALRLRPGLGLVVVMLDLRLDGIDRGKLTPSVDVVVVVIIRGLAPLPLLLITILLLLDPLPVFPPLFPPPLLPPFPFKFGMKLVVTIGRFGCDRMVAGLAPAATPPVFILRPTIDCCCC